jgi:catechol 2,3-dioxygenase-like lactoylglutathione lyase family enzyme
MKNLLLLLVSLSSCVSTLAQNEPQRPHILGIAGVQILSTDVKAACSFYSAVVDSRSGCGNKCPRCPSDPLPGAGATGGPHFIFLGSTQYLSLSKVSKRPRPGFLHEIVFATDDLEAMKKYLRAKKIMIRLGRTVRGGEVYFEVMDPEGHRIGFTEQPPPPTTTSASSSSMRMIHAGFVVRDRETEDRFYKDILGFHVYWQGGRKDGETDWVDMQVPEGTDWLEYMLNVPAGADHKRLGVMNHIAIGVPDVAQSAYELTKNGVSLKEQPKIGRGGKWQLNLYDPDDTRVELMEFTPTQKPCCSEYTGPHPGPNR